MRKILLACAMMALALPACAGATVGSTTVYTTSNADNGPGVAQDYGYTASASQTVDTLNVYLNSTSTAAKVELGIYNGTSSTATSLIAKCAIPAPVTGWNRCTIPSTQVNGGSRYWLAVLQPSGTSGHLVYREGSQSGVQTFVGTGTQSTLAATWKNLWGATGWAGSLYANQSSTPPPPPPPPVDSDGDGVPDPTDACPGTPVGTQVDSTGCPVVTPPPPPPPPSGFPDASNTGVPAGTTLTAYTGPCTITTANTVIDSKTVSCSELLIQAANVTVKNSKTGRIVIDTDQNRSWSLTLTDSEVDASSGDLPAIYNGNVTILRANIHGGHNGLECQEHSSVCSMKDSWIHDQWQDPTLPTHLGGFLDLGSVVPCTGPSANGVPACVELVHNHVTCDAPVNVNGGGCTGDINLINHFGPLHGALVENNLLGANTGAAFCTYGSAGFEYPADHIVYIGNTFQRGTNGKCADYGPVTNFDVNATGNQWTGNVWDDGGTVSPAN